MSVEVQRGEVFTLISPNGAGKTTVFHLISGICTPTTGSLHLDGALLSDKPPHAIAAPGIARIFQNFERFENATVLQNLLIGHPIHRPKGAEQPALQQGLEVAPAIGDDQYKRLRVNDAIDHAVGLEIHLTEGSHPHFQQLWRPVTATLGSASFCRAGDK